MKVKKLGSYLDVDSEGYLINPTSVDKLQEDWLPVVEEVKQKYIEHFGGDLISVYVRGSVAKGEAIDDISDVDTFAVVACRKEDIDLSWRDVFEKRMIKKHPHIVGIEIGALPVDALPELRAGKIMIKTQSVCIYGKELTDEIDPLKPGKETVQHVWSIGREITETKGWLSEPHTDEEIRTKCAWIMKRLLRTGFELVMERSQKYTRDLYLCYEGFAEYYPEKESEMYEVLELAISPTVDEKRILNILSTTGDWIASEVENIF